MLAGLFTGCKEAAEYREGMYFTGTEVNPDRVVTIDGPSEVGVSVSVSKKVEKDITVRMAVRPDLVEQYNEMTGKNYQALPAGSYEFPETKAVIKKGENISASNKLSVITIADFSEGVTYCMPVSIVSSDGDIPVLESSRTLYVVFNKTIITQAMKLGSNYYAVPKFLTETSLSAMTGLTMEARIYVNSFQRSSPFISSVLGIEGEMLMRFGDVKVDPAQFQVQCGGDYQPASVSLFTTHRWYHVAATYDGSKLCLYIDGKLDAEMAASGRGPINLTSDASGGFQMGRSYGGRYLDGYMSECRVWTRALNANELKNNLCYVDPTSDGLLAYWRLNGTAEGKNTVPDLTGHGFDAVGAGTASYMPDVRCPE